MAYSAARSQSRSNQQPRSFRPRQVRLTARAGMLLRRGMNFGPIRGVEEMFMDRGVSLAPMSCRAPGDDAPHIEGSVLVLPTAGIDDLLQGRLAGVVVPGGSSAKEEAPGIDKLVKAARAGGLPVMAFGEGVERALEALGYETPAAPPPGVLIDEGVQSLEQAQDVESAMQVFHRRLS